MRTATITISALFFGALLLGPSFGDAFAEGPLCADDKVLVYRVNSEKYSCLFPSTTSAWYERGIAEPVMQVETEQAEKEYLPLPEGALYVNMDLVDGYDVQEIADGVYHLAGFSHTTMFIVTGDGVIAVDAPPVLEDHYLDAVASVTDEPITHLIYTHSHMDHIGAASIFTDVEIIAHAATAENLQRHNDPNRPVPTVTFEDSFTLELGTKTVELDYRGPIHSEGNIFIYLPDEKVLMLVDIIYPNSSPFFSFGLAENMGAYIDAYDQILEYDFEQMVTGHQWNPGIAGREHVMQQAEFVSDVGMFAQESFANSRFGELIGRIYESEHTPLVMDTAIKEASSYCEQKIVEEWGQTLAAVDVFAPTQCTAMIFYHLVD